MIIRLTKANFSSNNIGQYTTEPGTLTFNVSPSNASWTLTCAAMSPSTKTGTGNTTWANIPAGSTVSYEVSLSGYNTQKGSISIYGNTLKTITLSEVGSVTPPVTPEEPGTGGGNTGGDSGNTINVYHTPDTFTMQIMWYQNLFKTMTGGTLDKYGCRMHALDVSNFIGKTLTLTATQAIIEGAYYAFFVSDMLPALLPENLPNLTAGSSTPLSGNYLVSKHVVATEVTDANSAGVVGSTKVATDTISIQIPSGSKYFYFTNAELLQKTPPSVTIN